MLVFLKSQTLFTSVSFKSKQKSEGKTDRICSQENSSCQIIKYLQCVCVCGDVCVCVLRMETVHYYGVVLTTGQRPKVGELLPLLHRLVSSSLWIKH